MVGIYKITSPSDRVYIGQSWNIEKRKSSHKSTKWEKQRFLYASIKKYGFDKHSFEVIHELPQDVSQEVMDVYEGIYMSQYKELGFRMMNIREAGSKGKQSAETLVKMRLANLGKKASEETKKKMSISGKSRIKNPESTYKAIQTKKERGNLVSIIFLKAGEKTRFKNGEISHNKGIPMKEETKEKIRLKLKGRKVWNKGIPFSYESKIKMSLAQKERFKNKPMATIKVICQNTGVIYSSQREAAQAIGVSPASICLYLKGISPNKHNLNYYFG